MDYAKTASNEAMRDVLDFFNSLPSDNLINFDLSVYGGAYSPKGQDLIDFIEFVRKYLLEMIES